VNGNDQPRSLLNVQASHEIAGNPIVGDRQPIDQSASFSAFVDETRIGLIRALAAHHPPQLASDVAADAFAWGWANWERLQTFSNPAGYLYRLADNRAKRTRQRDDRVALTASGNVPSGTWHDSQAEPELAALLSKLPDRQRAAVLLVHGYGYSYREAARLMDVPLTTLTNDVVRGMRHLRKFTLEAE
jgi:DNA-directed RNA polymerase specialized sigma24 family protein